MLVPVILAVPFFPQLALSGGLLVIQPGAPPPPSFPTSTLGRGPPWLLALSGTLAVELWTLDQDLAARKSGLCEKNTAEYLGQIPSAR